MKLIVLIPSYNRTNILKQTIASLNKHVSYDDLIVLEQEKGKPLGSGLARKTLLENAYSKYGDGHAFLMLDDDCTFDENSDVRWAMEHFADDNKLAIVQTPNAKKEKKDKKTYCKILYHCFIIRSDLIGRGFNYHPTEYADEVYFSFKVWLNGYSLIRTQRAYIRHHLTKRNSIAKFGGGIEGAYRDKLVKVDSVLLQEYGHYIDVEKSYRDGVLLPKNYSLKILKNGIDLHKINHQKIKPFEVLL